VRNRVPRVTFQPAGLFAEVAKGASILEAADAAGVELPANCGGVCACTTCHVWVLEGAGSLSEIEEREDDKLQEAAGLSSRSRLGCQARVGDGDVVVRVPGNRIKA
jgi:2Fe-2S ferredoxin